MAHGQSRSSRAVAQSMLMQRRREATGQVKTRFARFGDDVLNTVLRYALQPKTMPILLGRLDLRASGSLDAQLGAVWNFIAQSGPHEFFRRLRDPQPRATRQRAEPVMNATAAHAIAGWDGMERRAGTDRRMTYDRRGRIDAIQKNLRFGGDRRNVRRGRRNTDC